MSFPAVWSQTTNVLPLTNVQLDGMRAKIDERMRRWCDRNGYEPIGHIWSMDTETYTPPGELLAKPEMISATMTMTVTLRARMDGVWGSVRAALAEDGLLPLRDADDVLRALPSDPEPNPPWHRPVGGWGDAVVTYRCPDCTAVCPTETALRGHRRSAHGHGVIC